MKTFLALALLIIGSAATLAAFGGKTCEEGDAPLLKRIKARGWFSLVCLVLALALGAEKQLVTSNEEETAKTQKDNAEKEHVREIADAKLQQAVLSAAVDLANAKAELAAQKLENVKKNEEITQNRLSDTQTALNSTRADLIRQSEANLITAFANSNQKIKDIAIVIPLAKTAPAPEGVSNVFLSHFSSEECQDQTEAQLSVMTSLDHFEHIIYRADDSDEDHKYENDSVQKADFILNYNEPDLKSTISPLGGLRRMYHASSANGYMYFAAFRAESLHADFSQLYGVIVRTDESGQALAKLGKGPITISTWWPAKFRGPEEDAEARKLYFQHFRKSTISAWDRESDDLKDHFRILAREARQSMYPAKCAQAIQRHLKRSFGRAYLNVTLDNNTNETIAFPLKALPPQMVHNMWSTTFVIDGTPSFVSMPASEVIDWSDLLD